VNIFLWHVHGSWTTSFVQGPHRYLVPVLPDRGPDGLGRAETWDWPDTVIEVTPEGAREASIDVVILQRPHELVLATTWLGRRPGIDVPVVYLEHNTPPDPTGTTVHVATEIPGCSLVHVTAFNATYWDNGDVPWTVIDHGIVDPGYRYRGDDPSACVAINDPVRRGRAVGADLLPFFEQRFPVSLYGMRSEALGGADVPQHQMHEAFASHRVYLHLSRWTSLGLSLLEAMHLGMPVVALAATAVPSAIPTDAGIVETDVRVLRDAAAELLQDPERCVQLGKAARAAALERFGLDRFLGEWDALLEEVAA
jgi:glycosyltransferase involved in cell wall biosynthesis